MITEADKALVCRWVAAINTQDRAGIALFYHVFSFILIKSKE